MQTGSMGTGSGSCEAGREVKTPGPRQGVGEEGMAVRELEGWTAWEPVERAWGRRSHTGAGAWGRSVTHRSNGPWRRRFGEKRTS